MSEKIGNWFRQNYRSIIIGALVLVPLLVSLISTIHVIDFFQLSNYSWLAVTLAIAFEIGALSSLAALAVMDKISKVSLWIIFILITIMQMMGNIYYAFDFITIQMQENPKWTQNWIDLFSIQGDDIPMTKRILAIISGGFLPIISLTFLHLLVTYITKTRPIENEESVEYEYITVNENGEEIIVTDEEINSQDNQKVHQEHEDNDLFEKETVKDDISEEKISNAPNTFLDEEIDKVNKNDDKKKIQKQVTEDNTVLEGDDDTLKQSLNENIDNVDNDDNKNTEKSFHEQVIENDTLVENDVATSKHLSNDNIDEVDNKDSKNSEKSFQEQIIENDKSVEGIVSSTKIPSDENINTIDTRDHKKKIKDTENTPQDQTVETLDKESIKNEANLSSITEKLEQEQFNDLINNVNSKKQNDTILSNEDELSNEILSVLSQLIKQIKLDDNNLDLVALKEQLAKIVKPDFNGKIRIDLDPFFKELQVENSSIVVKPEIPLNRDKKKSKDNTLINFRLSDNSKDTPIIQLPQSNILNEFKIKSNNQENTKSSVKIGQEFKIPFRISDMISGINANRNNPENNVIAAEKRNTSNQTIITNHDVVNDSNDQLNEVYFVKDTTFEEETKLVNNDLDKQSDYETNNLYTNDMEKIIEQPVLESLKSFGLKKKKILVYRNRQKQIYEGYE